VTSIILPKDNAKDLEEIPADVREAMTIHLVENMDQVLELAFEPRPEATEAAPKVDLAESEPISSNIEAH
jgi:ATP-dependent Lon protease